ncbi:MAG: hypothetical protein ACO3JL_12375 [Myxococcota bacterium]
MKRMDYGVVVFLLLLCMCAGCAPGPDETPRLPTFNDTLDGGAPAEAGGPAAGFDTVAADPRCAKLVMASCEPSCEDSPSCAAARLLEELAPDRCAAALDDPQRYPSCRPSTCDDLVLRVCGEQNDDGQYVCFDDPGCSAALQLLTRSAAAIDPEEEDAANLACLQASVDETLFRDCQAP